MKLSVVILNYNVRYFLELCLKSVQAAIDGIEAEIIVVDNQSVDDSCDMVKSLFPNVILIQNEQNFGFSKGNNLGVKIAQGEYICILNPDTVVSEDCFKTLLNFADSQNNLGILGCRLIDGQGLFLPESKRHIPKPSVAIKKIFGWSKSYYASNLGEYETGKVPVFVGAFMLMRRAVYVEVGGFDEDYFMYGEDIDLSYKVLKSGFTNIYYGGVSVIHYKGESTLKDKTYAKRFYGAMQIFYDKHFKSNILFDALVWMGIRIATNIIPISDKDDYQPQKYMFLSSKGNTDLNNLLKVDVQLISAVKTYEQRTEYILDNNYISFGSIISILSHSPKNITTTFKILPKNSNFIIGSNSSKKRGEVLLLTNN